MTENMSRVLERIYRSRPQAGYAQLKTVQGLQRAGLVALAGAETPALLRRGDFPHYLASLTEIGRHFCVHHFGPV